MSNAKNIICRGPYGYIFYINLTARLPLDNLIVKMRSQAALKKASRLILNVLFFVFMVFGCAEDPDYPKNIILFIGDGMGVAHISAAKIARGRLNLERFSVSGLVTTHSEDNLTADSAAAATALATGYKTDSLAISVAPDKKPLKTLFEYAEELGKSTGVVVTSSVTDATPAAFFAHTDNRHEHSEIAAQILTSGIDVLIGGGWTYFVPNSNEGSRRNDEKNLLIALEAQMPVVLSYDKLPRHTNVKRLAALLTPVGLPKAADRNYSLAELTKEAIGILSKNRAGFVLMVEGSQIDVASHNQDQQNIISEMTDFDGAVGAGLDFAQSHPNTLIIVTADHETGGFAVHDGSIETHQVTSSGFTTSRHTAAMVPIFAYGPGSHHFSGIQHNDQIGRTIIAQLLQTKTANSDQRR
jgi:alkaline phosphatase